MVAVMPIHPVIAEEIRQLRQRQSALEAFDRDWNTPLPSAAALSAAQAEFAPTYRALGASIPQPTAGEGLESYRGRLIAPLLPHTEKFRSTDPHLIANTPLESEARKQVEAAIADRHKGDPITGRMRRVEVVDPETGARRTEYWGGSTKDWMASFLPNYQVATAIKTFDKVGNLAPPVMKWGHRPR
jgi:hypothetical protein